MALRWVVLDQDGLDRVDRPKRVPLAATVRFHNFIMATVVAFDNPMFHQHPLAFCKADRLGIAANGIGE